MKEISKRKKGCIEQPLPYILPRHKKLGSQKARAKINFQRRSDILSLCPTSLLRKTATRMHDNTPLGFNQRVFSSSRNKRLRRQRQRRGKSRRKRKGTPLKNEKYPEVYPCNSRIQGLIAAFSLSAYFPVRNKTMHCDIYIYFVKISRVFRVKEARFAVSIQRKSER